MPFILRTIRRGRWLANTPSETQEDRLARALQDLRLSEDNKLSVWYVEHDHSNLARLITALGANRDQPDNVDYVMLDEQWLLALGIQSTQTDGTTPDQEVNRRWHYDLVGISADQHQALAQVLLEHGHIERILAKRLLGLIEQAIALGHIDFERLKPGIQKKLVVQ